MNLAELAHAALTAGSRDTGAAPAVPTLLDSATEAAVADLCVRGDLGFALVLHRRKDGLVAEELYASTRQDDGSWAAADHLSGGLLGVEPASARDVAEVLGGRPSVLFGESGTLLFTGRPEAEADEGYELLRFFTLLVDRKVSHLRIEENPPGTAPVAGPTHKTLGSQAALIALFPGERVTVRPMTQGESGPKPLGEGHELTGPGPGPEFFVPTG